YRMPTICAALGISQLEKIDKIIELRRTCAKNYDDALRPIPNIQIMPELDGFKTVYQLYTVLVNQPDKRADLQEFLLKNEIVSKVYFYPIHLKTYKCEN
ncbi:MAG: DegT/DnrJ/EryC1/StrS family aminotransferase, partial [Candidatus Hodarchaeota archaeon]